ncbi:MAG: asparagine synthase (glutamine-hydrolyzing) [Patescibacteria group bacterium]
MCGINGFNFKNENQIRKMNLLTSHRGPDGTRFFCDDEISLGHNRLSILDLREEASQPMFSGDGNLVIVFNGEIYNFLEIKSELQKDYNFKTDSDTEVILAAYQKWGSRCLNRLNGIFAFAIWDKEKQELFIARDHLGVKPFYYYFDGDKFIFSSEIKSILAHPVERRLDQEALNIYFRLLYIPEPHTPWKNIFKLPPAHFAVLKNGKLEIKQYWKISHFDCLSDEQEIKGLIKGHFKEAVSRQLISDRPLGIYLSGGIDSTAILGRVSELRSKPAQTFTVGFEVESEHRAKFNADFELARKTSRFFKSEHHEVMLKARAVADNFEKVVWHGDDLVSNHTQTAMYVLSGMTKNHADVVLSGDGGDELFGGYDRYYLNYTLDRIQRLPKALRENFLAKFLFKLSGKQNLYDKLNIEPGIDRFLSFMSQKEADLSFLQKDFNQPEATRNFIGKKFFSSGEKLDFTKKMQYLDIKTWLLDDALNRSDRMSMAHGVEQRVPILDKEMVELSMAIPPSFGMDGQKSGKRIFKESLREYIPDFVYNQPKRGWFSPVAKWLRSDLKGWAYDILSPGYNPETEAYFDFAKVRKILDRHISGEKYALNPIWPLLTFQAWFKLFKNK